MSRSHAARRKARRRAEKVEAEARPGPRRRRSALLASLAIIALFLAAALVGFGRGGHRASDAEAQEHVAALLSDIPQRGNSLGSSDAPITLQMFADLECPTVKAFASRYLPTLVDRWVRNGTVRIEYRPLETDTDDERTFFAQEEATLAAGRQGRLWNYALTFLFEQGPHHTGYAGPQFFDGIAAQVPNLQLASWRKARSDPRLTGEVISSLHFAHSHATKFTPSFFIASRPEVSGRDGDLINVGAARRGIEKFLSGAISSLEEEIGSDAPTLRAFNAFSPSA